MRRGRDRNLAVTWRVWPSRGFRSCHDARHTGEDAHAWWVRVRRTEQGAVAPSPCFLRGLASYSLQVATWTTQSSRRVADNITPPRTMASLCPHTAVLVPRARAAPATRSVCRAPCSHLTSERTPRWRALTPRSAFHRGARVCSRRLGRQRLGGFPRDRVRELHLKLFSWWVRPGPQGAAWWRSFGRRVLPCEPRLVIPKRCVRSGWKRPARSSCKWTS